MQEGQEYGDVRRSGQAGEPGSPVSQPAADELAAGPAAGPPAGGPPPAPGDTTWQPPPPGEPGDTGWQPPPPRRRGRNGLVYLLVAVLAAAGGAGAAVALRPGSSPAAQSTGVSTAQIPMPDPNAPAGGTTVDPQAVAAKVERGIVDINSVIAYQNVPAAATGMVLSPNGLVLTNNHVVQGAARLTATSVTSGHSYRVKVIGVDPTQDVALIQLRGASGLGTVQVGDSAKVQLGMAVVAIGNAGGKGGSPTVTHGTITALDRTITASDGGANRETLHGMLQSNAPIQPGDSGGAWANSAGRVIGMTTAANSQTLGPAGTSMGFAIPIDKALSIARQIAAGKGNQNILIGTSGYMGVGVADVSGAAQCPAGNGIGGQAPVQSGAMVCAAYPGTPAARAGLSAGDVITGVNGKAVTSADSLSIIMRHYRPGNTISVAWVDTNGQHHTSSLTLAPGPPK